MRIEENNKPEFTKDIEMLLKKTRACQDIEITYGYVEYESTTESYGQDVVVNVYGEAFKRIFTPSKTNITIDSEHSEVVQIKVDGKTFYQSVEGDSYYGMVLDIVKRLDRENI
jgi:hypothetical protein